MNGLFLQCLVTLLQILLLQYGFQGNMLLELPVVFVGLLVLEKLVDFILAWLDWLESLVLLTLAHGEEFANAFSMNFS